MGLVTFGEQICPSCGTVFPDPPKLLTLGMIPSPLWKCKYCGITYCPNCSIAVGLRNACPNCGN